MELDTLKTTLIRAVKNRYQVLSIYTNYPDYKQRNIEAGRRSTAQDKIDMDTFIVSKLDDMDVIEADIDSLTNTDIYDNYDAEETLENRKAYIYTYLTSLTKDEQKEMAVHAIELLM